jgi:putative Ca2+/H+ antiporter (TMEM165/GDT1 family)
MTEHDLRPADCREAYSIAFQMVALALAGDRGQVLALLLSAEHPSIVAWCLAQLVGQVAHAVADAANFDVDLRRVLTDMRTASLTVDDHPLN